MATVNQLLQYLTANNNIGRQNPITAGNLATHFGISDGGVQVEMRNVIRNAIAQGYLIGSCNRGFYIINSLNEIEHNLNSLRSRAEKILIRRRNMLNFWNNMSNQQNPTSLLDLEIRDV
ncbi:MAG: hypothetical protein JEY97_09855 [Bacteroidales bacterium]|nr:hypothetical protein [Bacteroidales bacterium]